jgi:hypothetical protein
MIIDVQFDTKTKSLSAKLGGEEIKDIASITIFGQGENQGSIEVRTVEMLDDDQAVKVTKIFADEQEAPEKETEDEDIDYAEMRKKLGLTK